MEQKDLEVYIEKGMSSRDIAKLLECSQKTIQYWLNKFNLHTNYCKLATTHKCILCNTTNREDFPKKGGKVCKKCKNVLAIQQQKITKATMVDFLGGCCSKCGYSRCSAALEIHHINPETKDDNFRNIRSWSWERIQKELKNCVLLCANCHRELHNTQEDPTILQEVVKETQELLLHTRSVENKKVSGINKHPCKVCKTAIPLYNSYCSDSCQLIGKRKCVHPPKEELEVLIQNNSLVAIGKLFGVSGNAVKKWAKTYKLA